MARLVLQHVRIGLGGFTHIAGFERLIGSGEKRERNRQSNRLGSFEVDHQVELGRLLHWHVGGLGATQ